MTDSDATGDAIDPILDAGSSAVVAFSLAALVLLGNNLMVQATQSLFGLFFTGAYDKATFFVTWLFGALVPALGALGLGRRAFADPAATPWQRTVGKAAFLLAIVAMLFSGVMIIGGLIHDPF